MGKRPGHSCTVTTAAVGVFILSGAYVLQFVRAFSQYDMLQRLPLSVPPWYFLLGGAFWGCVWLAGGVGLLQRKEWGRRLVLVALPLQFIAWLGDRLLTDPSSVVLQSFGFDAALRLLLVSAGILVMVRQHTIPEESRQRGTNSVPPAAAEE